MSHAGVRSVNMAGIDGDFRAFPKEAWPFLKANVDMDAPDGSMKAATSKAAGTALLRASIRSNSEPRSEMSWMSCFALHYLPTPHGH